MMVILGNVISFIGCILMVGIGFIKQKNTILVGQCIQFGLQGAGHLFLGSIPGMISCGVSILRNLFFSRRKVTVWLKLSFIALQTVLTVATGPQNLIQWLPLVAVVPYTWYLDTENVVLFKLVNIFGCVCWIFHDFYYLNYAAGVFDILAVVSTGISVFQLLREKKQMVEQKSIV